MTKNELIIAIAEETGQPRTVVESCLNSLANRTQAVLQFRSEVTLPGIGKLSTTERSARDGRNPRTGEVIKIPAKTVVKFKVAKALADSVA